MQVFYLRMCPIADVVNSVSRHGAGAPVTYGGYFLDRLV